MIYLIMCGRLGNQLFQYSFARKIQEETGQPLAIDFTAVNQVNSEEWKNYLKYYNISEYLEVNGKEYFPIQRFIYRVLKAIRPKKSELMQYYFDELSAKIFARIGVIYYESDYKYHNYKQIKAKNIIIRGWFESAKYFDSISDLLKKELSLKQPLLDQNSKLARELKHSISICVTIRRGNFTEDKYKAAFLVCTQDYYYNAVACIRKKFPNATVYVCSDDIEWCKNELHFPGKVIFEPANEIWEKLYLMSCCSHFVLSNSTFSWWAQYLSNNTKKMVIAPNIWRNCKLPPQDIFDEGWILMDKEGNIYSGGD